MILRHAFIPLDNKRLAHLCGALDGHLRAIESALGVTIARRNESFHVEGVKAAAERAVALLQTLYERSARPIGDEAEGGYLPPWDLGVRVALTIAGPVGSEARFDWVRIESASEPE